MDQTTADGPQAFRIVHLPFNDTDHVASFCDSSPSELDAEENSFMNDFQDDYNDTQHSSDHSYCSSDPDDCPGPDEADEQYSTFLHNREQKSKLYVLPKLHVTNDPLYPFCFVCTPDEDTQDPQQALQAPQTHNRTQVQVKSYRSTNRNNRGPPAGLVPPVPIDLTTTDTNTIATNCPNYNDVSPEELAGLWGQLLRTKPLRVSNEKYKCPHCNAEFRAESYYPSHVTRVHMPVNDHVAQTVACMFTHCMSKFCSLQRMYTHIFTHYPDQFCREDFPRIAGIALANMSKSDIDNIKLYPEDIKKSERRVLWGLHQELESEPGERWCEKVVIFVRCV